jgi:ankyrin repeat protein
MEYKKVVAALHRMIGTISTKLKRQALKISEEQRSKLLNSLRYDQIYSRYTTIKKSHRKTCEWLLGTPDYIDWLDDVKQHEHHGFLWIKGNPGTGKSTLIKFALANAQAAKRDTVILYFFFNARGNDLEKSTIGMYRSLLLQLLEQVPELQCVLDPLWSTWRHHHQWSIELLEEVFEQAIQNLKLRSTACFIDALDECADKEIRRMISFFERVGYLAISNQIRFHVCFSSRHYPHITITQGLSLVLEGQEGHSQDITNYVDIELRIGCSNIAKEIRNELREKASGVFMWVVLVVNILNEEYDGGRIYKLRQRLRDIPSDLHKLFHDILTRDSVNRDQLILCVQWILFAQQPLKPEQLYFAILSGVEPEELSSCHSNETTLDDIKRFILHSSKGLAEITKSKSPTVQFIHESVRDFFLKVDGVSTLWESLGNNFLGQSHERLKQCCLRYMSIDTITHLTLNEPLPKESSQEAATLHLSAMSSFPFLEYAVHHVLHHANLAEGSGISQQGFIQEFPLTKWIKLDNLFGRHEIRPHTLKASLLYILAERNMSNLIRIHPRNLFYLEVEDEHYGAPLLAALATSSIEAFKAFLKIDFDKQTEQTSLNELSNRIWQRRGNWADIGYNFKFSENRSVFSYILEREHDDLSTFLLETGKVDIESEYRRDSWLFILAVKKGHESVVKVLLTTVKPNVNSTEHGRMTAFMWAAEKGHNAIAKILLETDEVDVNSRTIVNRTALSLAAGNGHETIVELILATGKADMEVKDLEFGYTPLNWATIMRHEAVVRLLLETSHVDVESKGKSGQTPLSNAAMYGRDSMVRLLLEKGQANVEVKDKSGQTPLSIAAMYGRDAVVRLLIEIGRANVESKDKSGQTPLSNAAVHGRNSAARLLLKTGQANADSKDRYGQTPLLNAVVYGRDAVVRSLLDTGQVDVESKDIYGQTPLSNAARLGSEVMVRLLLETGQINVESKDNYGQTPLWWAVKQCYEAVVRLLVETGQVNVESKNNNGHTPLSWAAKKGYETIVKILLEAKANVHSKDNHGC